MRFADKLLTHPTGWYERSGRWHLQVAKCFHQCWPDAKRRRIEEQGQWARVAAEAFSKVPAQSRVQDHYRKVAREFLSSSDIALCFKQFTDAFSSTIYSHEQGFGVPRASSPTLQDFGTTCWIHRLLLSIRWNCPKMPRQRSTRAI